MKTAVSVLCLLLLAAFPARRAAALDAWQYPEAADKNALFAGLFSPALSFSGGFLLESPEFFAEWIVPFGLPFSLGAYFTAPAPNLKSFGLRAGYHINPGGDKLDLYALYVFDFGFLRNDRLAEYGDEAQEIRWYDFRAGVRYRIGRSLCLCVETGFKLQSLRLGLAVKLN